MKLKVKDLTQDEKLELVGKSVYYPYHRKMVVEVLIILVDSGRVYTCESIYDPLGYIQSDIEECFLDRDEAIKHFNDGSYKNKSTK